MPSVFFVCNFSCTKTISFTLAMTGGSVYFMKMVDFQEVYETRKQKTRL